MFEDFSIMQKTNKGETKIMNIYTVAHLLTIDEIKRLTSGKRVRKGHYLYFLVPYEPIEIKLNFEDVVELDECVPFKDLESDDFDSCAPFEDLDDEDKYDEDDISGEDFSDEDLDGLSDEELFILLKNMTPEDRKIALEEADLTEEERTNIELMLSKDDEEGYIQ